ncbi:MAG: GTP 3',8-cyclase MoaA [Pirellulaceae bacterium]|nr:GTP 3',8-cyclase MoaA [Pirellulaceae bacterium]
MHETEGSPVSLSPAENRSVATSAAVPPATESKASPKLAQASQATLPLIDSFGRVHRSLRISVTDRCNIRCQYCMPEVAQFMDSEKLLSFEEIAQFARISATLGIRKLRITGGEPLMRPELHRLLRMLCQIESLEGLALTTNGMLLAQQIDDLVAAGLRRVNISLDTLNEEVFRRLSRRSGLDQVLAGIEAAIAQPLLVVRLNALVMRDVNFDEVLDLVGFARERNLALRFIEFMPLDAERAWNRSQMVSGDEMRARIEGRFGKLVPAQIKDPAQPATDFAFANGSGLVGFIDSVTQPFCSACDRLRLTADGKLRNCLFGREEWDVREVLRSDAVRECQDAAAVEAVVRTCLRAKRAAHGIDAADFSPPVRAMFQIGG